MMTKKNRTPLPLISKTINELKEAKSFLKVDVRWGFNNICIADSNQENSAFLTKQGLFEPTVMFFGLTNSPMMFQTMMNNILHPSVMEGKVLVYMDDIIVFMNDIKEHWRITQEVLEILKKNNLYLKPKKWEFEKMMIGYLRVVLSQLKPMFLLKN
jgi:hypothetical protein